MALTLTCSCFSAQLCQLIKLTWHVETHYVSDGVMGASCHVGLYGDQIAVHAAINTDTGHAVSDINLDIAKTLASWGSLCVKIWSENTLSIGRSYPGCTISTTFHIAQDWMCHDPVTGEYVTKRVYSYGVGSDTKYCPDALNIQVWGAGGGGSGFVTRYWSSPLADCGVDFYAYRPLILSGFSPRPDVATLSVENNPCLCPQGGTPPYSFSVASGMLPCGVSLNPSTGCLEGSPDGSCSGSQQVTFQVTDHAGEQAQATCNFIPVCGGNVIDVPNSFY